VAGFESRVHAGDHARHAPKQNEAVMGAPQVPIGVAVLLMVPSEETEQSGSTTVRIAGGDHNHRYRTDQARQVRIPERESTGDTDGEMRNGPQRVILIRVIIYLTDYCFPATLSVWKAQRHFSKPPSSSANTKTAASS
jgi:hypothetical protein